MLKAMHLTHLHNRVQMGIDDLIGLTACYTRIQTSSKKR
jgi:hypothetical protein